MGEKKEATHETRRVQPCVDIVIFRRGLHLQNDLDETTRKVLHENNFLQCLLQNGLEMAFAGAYICCKRKSPC